MGKEILAGRGNRPVAPVSIPDVIIDLRCIFSNISYICGGVENIRRRIEELSYGMPHIRSMTSKKDCHSKPSFLSSRSFLFVTPSSLFCHPEPSFLSSRAIARDLIMRHRPNEVTGRRPVIPNETRDLLEGMPR